MFALLLPLIFPQVAEEPPSLSWDQWQKGVISDDHPMPSTPALEQGYSQSTIRFQRYRVRSQHSGVHYFRLRSWAFDSYLILRDAEFNLVAEDDDGWMGVHSQIVTADLIAGRDYWLDACGLRAVGDFQILGRVGEPETTTPDDWRMLELEDAHSAVAWATETYGEDSVPFAHRTHELGLLLIKYGRAVDAEPHLASASRSFQQQLPEGSHEQLLATYDWALCLQSLGRLEQSQQAFRVALKGWEQKNGPNDFYTANCKGALGDVLRQQAKFQEATELFQQALEVLEAYYANDELEFALNLVRQDPHGLASHLNNAALLLSDLGHYSEAREYFERSLAIDEKILPNDHPDLASTRNNIGILLHQQGLYAAARELYTQTLQARRALNWENQHPLAEIHHNLAQLDMEEGKLDDARAHLQTAVTLEEQTYGPDHIVTAQAISGLGRLKMRMEAYDEAAEQFKRVHQIRERDLGPSHPLTLANMRNLATALQRMGMVEPALKLMETVFERNLASADQNVLTTAGIHGDLARLLAAHGRLAEAWDYAVTAIELRRRDLAVDLAALTESEQFQALAEMQWSLDLLVSIAAGLPNPEFHRLALAEVLAWKGISTRLLIAGRRHWMATQSERTTALLHELRGVQSTISGYLYNSDGNAGVEADELANLRKRRNQLELEVQREVSATAVIPLPDVGEIQKLLDEKNAFLCMFAHRDYAQPRRPSQVLGEEERNSQSVTAWVVQSSRIHVVRLGKLEQLSDAIHKLKVALGAEDRGGRTLEQRRSPNDVLRELLWKPLAPHFDGVEQILVSPSAFLGGVPLEVLQLKDQSFLIEHFRFAYTQNVSELLKAQPAEDSETDNQVLAVGDVDYFAQLGEEEVEREFGGEIWMPLPYTKREIDAIGLMHQRYLQGAGSFQVLSGKQATEQALKSQLPGKQILHLAIHGYFYPESLPSMWDAAQSADGAQAALNDVRGGLLGHHPGLLTGLVCAGANMRAPTDSEDAYLTAEEVAWLDLKGVDLVVLSACQTGLGRPQTAEGMISLSRAFHQTGARTVISSLWKVRDDSTSELMTSFYRNLWQKKMSKLEALRTAQLQLLEKNRRTQSGQADPHSWGAFVLSGDWR